MRSVERSVGFTATIFACVMLMFQGQGAIAWLQEQIAPQLSLIPVHVILLFAATVAAGSWRAIALGAGSLFLTTATMLCAICLLVFAAATSDFGRIEVEQMGQIGVGLLVAMGGAWFGRSATGARRIVNGISFGVLLSALLALAEFVSSRRAPWALGDEFIQDGAPGVSGFDWFPVAFAYSIGPATAFLLVAGAFRSRDVWLPSRWWCLLGGLVGSAALIASGSRSGVLGVGVGAVFGAGIRVKLAGLSKPTYWALSLACVAVAGSLASFISGKSDAREDVRWGGTYMTYIPVILVNPLGLPNGAANATQIAEAHAALGLNIDEYLFTESSKIAPHNAFMSAGVRYGWIGPVALLLLYFWPARQMLALARNRRLPDGVQTYSAALLGALIATAVHMSFHNASIVLGEMRSWVYIGLSVGLYTVTTEMLATHRLRM